MQETRRIRALIYSSTLEGHWRGVAVVTVALRDAGIEVIYGGPLTPEQAANTAIQEDVDVVGVSVGGRYQVVEKMLALLGEEGQRPLVIAGGTIAPPDIPVLKAMGVDEVFPPGSRLDAIVDYIKDNVPVV
ncbi:MAG TPA: cobalamin-dependent protein [Gammaproteobacteria bacterium]|nr:cobalamin-dependent protein [Gammaproteobacteria bacterium]